MGSILAATLLGAATGFMFGLAFAVCSRDGIWPGVWAGLIIAFAGFGFIGSLIEWLLG